LYWAGHIHHEQNKLIDKNTELYFSASVLGL
jgi:hypothetical protein